MHNVAGSVTLRRGKLLSKALSALRYSSLALPDAHISFSMEAACKTIIIRYVNSGYTKTNKF
jgi:hypothetical protein